MARQSDLFSGILPFVFTAEERSFGRAAARLGVTTAAVSKAVRKLEADLGVRLLNRTSRAVVLTKEGELFLERSREAIANVQGARELMSKARGEPQGELAVTLPFILAPFVVPGLSRLSAQYPRLGFRVSLSDRLTRLVDERFDVAIRMGELESSTLVARLLRKTRWVTVASPVYLARRPAPASPSDLQAHNCLKFVGPAGKPREFSFTDGDGRVVTERVKGNLVIDHGEYLLQATESGLGVCQALDFMVADLVHEGRLVELLFGFAAEGPRIHALTAPGRANAANVRAFVRFLVDAFRA